MRGSLDAAEVQALTELVERSMDLPYRLDGEPV